MQGVFSDVKQFYKTKRGLHFWLDEDASSKYMFSTNRSELDAFVEMADMLPGMFCYILHIGIVIVNAIKIESFLLNCTLKGFLLYSLFLFLAYVIGRSLSFCFAIYVPILCNFCLFLYLPTVMSVIRFVLIVVTSKIVLDSYWFVIIYYALGYVFYCLDVVITANHVKLDSDLVRHYAQKLGEGDLGKLLKYYE